MARPADTDRNIEIYELWQEVKAIPDNEEKRRALWERILLPFNIGERRVRYIEQWVEENVPEIAT